MDILGIVATIVIALLIIGIIIFWIYIKRKSNNIPIIRTKQGCVIIPNDVLDRKDEIEEAIDIAIDGFGNSGFFKMACALEQIPLLTIILKSKPFPPEGPITGSAKLLSGLCDTMRRRVVIYVPIHIAFKRTAFFHEVCHYLQFHCFGVEDWRHTRFLQHWQLVDELKRI